VTKLFRSARLCGVLAAALAAVGCADGDSDRAVMDAAPLVDEVDAAPDEVDAAPDEVDAAPDLVDAAPGLVDAAPDLVDAAPDLVDAAPVMADASPDVDGAPIETDAAPGAASILITEVMDHGEEPQARFVELYNAGTVAQDLTGWKLRRYSNGKTAAMSISLDPVVLEPGSTWVIAYNTTVFTTTYGREPDAENRLIQGNGNDSYELVDADELRVDLFGEIGFDRDDPIDWDYADSVAQRVPAVTAGNPVWTAAEWTILPDMSTATPGER